MRRSTWSRIHRVTGLAVAALLMLECVSGIALNHREALAGASVSRAWLPERYRFSRWNMGLMRQTARWRDSVLVCGAAGVLRADTQATSFEEFNDGIPPQADLRAVRSIAVAPGGAVFAISQFALFGLDEAGGHWLHKALPLGAGERLTDMTVKGDTLVVMSRSRFFLSTPPYSHFAAIEPGSSRDYDGSETLFRTVWKLHSGQLFGPWGQMVADGIGCLMIVLCASGLALWALRKMARGKAWMGRRYAEAMALHNGIGRRAMALTLAAVATGWALRPPLMIPLALCRTAPPPLTTLDDANPWADKLRMARHDKTAGRWLISTSAGFFSADTLGGEMRRVAQAPPVSVMGLNVFEREGAGAWLCGSFSGLFRWDAQEGLVTDFFTGDTVAGARQGPPFGARAVSGYSADFVTGPFAVEYEAGTDSAPQPEGLRDAPMSLWALALEAHSGRIFFGNAATYFYIFIFGGAAILAIVSGWRVRRSGKKKLRQGGAEKGAGLGAKRL